METVKSIIAIIASIIGVVTAILTAYAKFLDVKKQAVKDRVELAAMTRPPEVHVAPAPPPEPSPIGTTARNPPTPGPPAPRPDGARQAVRAPATAMIALGVFSLFLYLVVLVVGLAQEFGATNNPPASAADAVDRQPGGTTDRETTIYGVVGSLYFMMASGVAVLGGTGMIRLRGYWSSVAGSVAVMMGSGCCLFFVGIPVGIWSLVVLFRPEVAASFE